MPGGYITGFSNYDSQLMGKWLGFPPQGDAGSPVQPGYDAVEKSDS
jgi:hypothetical protein